MITPPAPSFGSGSTTSRPIEIANAKKRKRYFLIVLIPSRLAIASLHPCRLPDDDEGAPDAGVGFLLSGSCFEEAQSRLPHHLAVGQIRFILGISQTDWTSALPWRSR